DAGARVLRDGVDGAAVAGGDRRVALRADAGGGGGAEAPAAVARAADEVGPADRRGGEPDRAVVADREVRLHGGAGRVDRRRGAEGEAAGGAKGRSRLCAGDDEERRAGDECSQRPHEGEASASRTRAC